MPVGTPLTGPVLLGWLGLPALMLNCIHVWSAYMVTGVNEGAPLSSPFSADRLNMERGEYSVTHRVWGKNDTVLLAKHSGFRL